MVIGRGCVNESQRKIEKLGYKIVYVPRKSSKTTKQLDQLVERRIGEPCKTH